MFPGRYVTLFCYLRPGRRDPKSDRVGDDRLLQIGGDVDGILTQGDKDVTHPLLLRMEIDHVHADDRPGPGADFQIAQIADGRVGRASPLMELRIRIAAGAVDLDFLPLQGAERYAHRASHPADKTLFEVVHRIVRVTIVQGPIRPGSQSPLPVDVQTVVQLVVCGLVTRVVSITRAHTTSSARRSEAGPACPIPRSLQPRDSARRPAPRRSWPALF